MIVNQCENISKFLYTSMTRHKLFSFSFFLKYLHINEFETKGVSLFVIINYLRFNEELVIDGWVVENDADLRTHIFGS